MGCKRSIRVVCFFIISFFLFIVQNQAFAQIPQTEREALIALYNSTNGDNWTNNSGWKDEPLADNGFAMPGTENDWRGVICEGGSVISIKLAMNNLIGEIPPEIGNLTNLTYLDMFGNQLTGEILPWIGNLTDLIFLNLTSNQLTGEIPHEIGNLTNLSELWLIGNQLTGEIPAEIGNLTNLRRLYLTFNQLTGEIPPWIGNLTNLIFLDLSSNQLTGEIPAEIGNLTNLGGLYLTFNQLTGDIPPWIGNLTYLRFLNLSSNQLTGEIPAEIGNLTDLQRFFLQGNHLSGEIPPTLKNLIALEELNINNNWLDTDIEDQTLILFLDSYDPAWKTTQGRGSISGIVKDYVTGDPVEGATITLAGNDRTATTDSTGSYAITYLAVGDYTVSVDAFGYISSSADVVITDETTAVERDFDLLQKGDVDASGEVNLMDALLALKVAMGLPADAEIFNAADVNEDGRIGLEEVIYILQKVAIE